MPSHDHPTAALPEDLGGPKRPQAHTPTVQGGALAGAGGLPAADDRIGPYRIVRQLGEGGFGVVYLAEQETPVRRQVALKIIKIGMDTVQVVARFEQERQALAVMDHPSIARVFDAGSTAAGRPYFVMEYVAGEPITDYCDRHQLSTVDRLQLFLPVCDAVQHAHNKGVIHRDIKPSNVLVSVREGQATPKIIDFGVAKAINSRLSEKTIFTEFGQIIGTPEYMSPEQAEMGMLDIDTRSDVYSLGVLLYELLTGLLPFDSRALRSAGYAEIQRIIREVDPPRPSTRLSAAGDAAASIARNRHAQAATLERDLRRELEWIPLMAMRKDRTQRYRSVSELADDIRAYLNGLPLKAGPQSAAYHVRKFVRRHHGKVAVACGALALLVAATVVSAYFAKKEHDARERESQALASEKEQRRIADLVNDFLVNRLLNSADPEVDGADVKVVTVLQRAAKAIEVQTDLPPAVAAAIQRTLGQTYLSIGEPETARTHLHRARTLVSHLRAAEPDIEAIIDMAIAETHWRQGQTSEAIALLEPLHKKLASEKGPADALTLDALNQLGGAYKRGGMLDDADRVYRECLDGRTQTLGSAHESTLLVKYNIALVRILRGQQFATAGDPAAATTTWEDALLDMRAVHAECVASLGADHPQSIWAQAEVATTLIRLNKQEEARAACAAVLPFMRQRFGPESFRTLETLANYSFLCRAMNRHDEAVIALEEALHGYRKVRGPAYGDTVVVASWLASSYESIGRYSDEIALLKRTYDDLVAASAAADQQRQWAGFIHRFYVRRDDAASAEQWRDRAGITDESSASAASQPAS